MASRVELGIQFVRAEGDRFGSAAAVLDGVVLWTTANATGLLVGFVLGALMMIFSRLVAEARI